VVQARILALPSECRDFLAAAAAHAHPTIGITETASGVPAELGLRPALDRDIVEVDRDRIRFTHPLLAASAYETADPVRRREIHVRLAELLSDLEARAWQLAACVDAPDATVAAVLDDAARSARARGAPRPAALLLERARDLTPDPDERRDRAIDAAFFHFESGDSLRAQAQLEALVSELAPGSTRARALVRLARVRSYEAQEDAVELFLRAVAEADADQETLAAAHEGVAACFFRLRDRLDEAVEHAESATRIATSIGDDALAAEATGTKLIAETLLGVPAAAKTADSARALQGACADRRTLAQPLLAYAVHAWWSDQLVEARDLLLDLLRRARELGDESSLPYVLVLLGRIEAQLGLYTSADERARDGQEAAEQSGQRTLFAYNLALEALAAAHLGSVERARFAGTRALDLVPETGGRPPEHLAREALGQLELASGAPEAAVELLVPAVEFARAKGIREPGALRFPIDLVEAWAEGGRREEAVELVDWYEDNARRLERASALANCARCRGLLAAQRGDLEGALALFEEALSWHAKVELPLDRGRTLLALGAAQRRLKRRREARATLEEALGVFERIGAALWAERARGELKRISGRAATPGALTPAEERVATLVAQGKTNKEVAAALFVSERTVEGHLARIFGKLGIRNRTEVASVLARSQTQVVAPPNTGGAPVSAEPSAP
jgi:DNA-binding CsgD family transcriptional regulator